VTYLLKVGIAEEEQTAVAREWLCKKVFTETNSRVRSNRFIRINRITVRSGIFYAVGAEVK
jgi:hypothetical protein